MLYRVAAIPGEAILSWCDKLASTAGAGLKLDFHFASADSILDGLSPLLDRMPKGNKPKFDMSRHESFAVTFTTDDGFQYGIEPSKVFVAFKHRLRARAVSGRAPIMEMLSQPMPFTKLLPTVCKKLIEVTLLIPGPKNRKADRVGIISTTSVAESELPPGIARFISYMGRPWKGSVDHYNFNITTEISKTAEWTDRCLHTLTKPDDPEELLTLNFDWQRTFASGRPLNENSLTEALKTSEKAALQYFEDLGEGPAFDEEIIRSTTRT